MVAYSGLENIGAVLADWQVRNPNAGNPPTFPDVLSTHPQYDEIMALATMGVITGGDWDGIFGFHPDNFLTRVDATAGLARAMIALGYDHTDYPDADEFSEWHRNSAAGGFASWARPFISFMVHYEIFGMATTLPCPEGMPQYLPALAFDTQQLITGMVRMAADTIWGE